MLLAAVAMSVAVGTANAQSASIRYGTEVPSKVKSVYSRGLNYLAQSQADDGSWAGGATRSPHGAGGESGITGMCVMAFLASGEDPNYGKYSLNIRKAVRSIIQSQDKTTGYLPGSMYHHGFAMLGLSEAYGAIDEKGLWQGQPKSDNQRGIGQALELAVRCAVTSQSNSKWGGWRYSPQDGGADTSVSGAVLMGLLAARNAGIEVPDTCIEKALGYYRSSTSDKGMVAYTGGIGGSGASMNRSAIATLVYSVGKKKDWKEYSGTLDYISKNLTHEEQSYPIYFRYYMAQALFQGDFDAWSKWNRETTDQLANVQQSDGSFIGNQGPAYATSMSLLALALNYRFLPIYER